MPTNDQVRSSRWPEIAGPVVAGLLLIAALEGMASLAVDDRPVGSRRMQEEKHARHDAELGWTHIPNRRIEDMYGAGRNFTTNAQSLRAPRNYSREIPGGTYRVVCLGDSFTMGYGVDDSQTFPAQLETRTPGLEAINMGMGAYGIDQSYLWYARDGVHFDTDLLLFAFIDLDFQRITTNVYRAGYPKPLLGIEDGELRVSNVPVPYFGLSLIERFLQRSSLARLVAGRQERPRPALAIDPTLPFAPVAERILVELKQLSTRRGQEFVLAYLPRRKTLRSEADPLFAWLSDVASENDLRLINVRDAFDGLSREGRRLHFNLPRDSHYSPLGNAIVAEYLRDELRRLLPEFPRQGP